MNKEIRTDIVVVGAGIAGLMATREFTKKGFKTVLIEKSDRLADGATTKNQGWAHSGALQANTPLTVFTKEQRRATTADVRRGFEAIRSYAPECIEDPNAKTFAIFSRKELGEQARENWSAEQIPHKPVTLARFLRNEVTGINPTAIEAVFEMNDKSIDTTVLCRKLARDIIHRGGEIFTHTDLKPIDSEQADLDTGDTKLKVKAGLFVVTAGAGIKKFFEDYTGTDFPMRYWQGATLVMPSLTRHGIIWQEPGGVHVMPHGITSVMSLNANDSEIENPHYDLSAEKIQALMERTQYLFPEAEKYKNQISIAGCLKPYIASANNKVAIDIRIDEGAPGYYYFIPGKMTATQVGTEHLMYIAEHQESLKLNRPSIPEITSRPCDVFVANK